MRPVFQFRSPEQNETFDQELSWPKSRVLNFAITSASLTEANKMSRHTRIPAAITGFALLSASLLARAIEMPDATFHALPCRPTIACTADIVSPGAFEIETGYILRSLAGGTVQHSTPTLFKLTFAHWVQLQVGGNGYIVATGAAPAHYFDDVSVGLKFHLVPQGTYAPSIALSAAVAFPVIEHQQSYLPTTDIFLTAYVTRDFGWLHADLNAGVNLWRVDANTLVQRFVALALSTALDDYFGFMVEGYAYGDAAPAATRDAGILAAVAVSPRTWLTFDVGGDIGLFPSVSGFSLFAGLTIVPVDFWDSVAEARIRAAERLRLRDIPAR